MKRIALVGDRNEAMVALRDELPPLVRAFVAAVAATPEVGSPMGAPR
ncbi:MAG: hypothetical protein KC619_11605 [Myxococcales bacterium]|nr:hypothetical protein [Myxococcales bacterium]